jgi:hypothetical protein
VQQVIEAEEPEVKQQMEVDDDDGESPEACRAIELDIDGKQTCTAIATIPI